MDDFFDDEEIPPENFSGACGPRPTPSMKNLKGKDERVLVYIKDRVEHNDNVNRAPESTVVISCKFEIRGQKYMRQGKLFLCLHRKSGMCPIYYLSILKVDS